MPAVAPTDARQFRPIYGLRVPALRPADVVHIVGQFQLVNDNIPLVQIVRYLARNGSRLTPAMGDNLDTNRHYAAIQLAGIDTGQSGDTVYTIEADAVILRGQEITRQRSNVPPWLERLFGSAQRWSGTIGVVQGYGFLRAVVFRSD
jgi:hypothetical protein